MCCKHFIGQLVSNNTQVMPYMELDEDTFMLQVYTVPGAYSRFCGDRSEQRDKKKFFSHRADILEHRKTLNKINKMCFLLHVDTCCREN